MPDLSLRWSEHEAAKAYARPFGVSFLDDSGDVLGSVAVSGAELLYHRQFQVAVLALTGELFSDVTVSAAADPQRAWLDRLSALLPPLTDFTATPESSFEHDAGRRYRFTVSGEGIAHCQVDAALLAEYQEFQAAVAHQTGRLYRRPDVEDIDDHNARQAAWWRVLAERVSRPAADEAMSESWPWR